MMSVRFRLLSIRRDFSPACRIGAVAISLLVAVSLEAQPALFRKDIWVGERPSGLVVADFNGDGLRDISIVVGWPRKTLVLLNRGGSAFEPPINSELACSGSPGEFNGDGKLDLASSEGNVQVCLGEGDGRFRVSRDTGILGTGLAVGDFNGDGRSDLAVSSSAQSVAILLGNGDGTFHLSNRLSPGGQSPHAADFNRDGKIDLVLINAATDSLFVFLGAGEGTFREPSETSVPGLAGAAFGIQVVDWNRDGHMDVLTARAILLGRGDGGFFSPLRFNDDNKRVYPSPSGVADFDGDGALDILMSYQGEGGEVDFVSLFAGKGDGTVSRSVEYAAGQQAHGAITGDLDGDGRPDIVVANVGSDSVSVLLNQFGLPGAVSSASLMANTGAPESLMTLLVPTGATEPVLATPPWPARLGGVSLEIRDSTGMARLAPLVYISETQINFQIPAETAEGGAILFITHDRGVRPVGALQVAAVAPALFMLSPYTPAATAVSVAPDGSQTPVQAFTCFRHPDQPEVQSCDPTPILLSKDPIYLSFYGTGFRGADATRVTCLMNGLSIPVTYAGPQGTPGVDQITVRLSPELLARTPAGAATWVESVLSLDHAQANRAWIKVH